MKRRPTDQRLVVDLTNAVDITYIVGTLTGQKQDKDNGVELPKYANERTWYDRALSIIYYLNDSLGDITGDSTINDKLVHVADARGVIIWQERYKNYQSFYPQENK